MTKVRVQDATKELSTSAGRMLENVTRLRKQSQDVLGSLRKISDGFVREEKERQERAAKEELRKQYEASAQFMTAYSSEHVPEVTAAEVAAKAASAEVKAPEQPVAPKETEQPAPVQETASPAPAREAEKAPVRPEPAVSEPAAAQVQPPVGDHQLQRHIVPAVPQPGHQVPVVDHPHPVAGVVG